jgi:hypothetical protein
MWIRTTCDLAFQMGDPTPLILMLRPRSGAQQWVAREAYTLTPSVPVEEYTDIFGNLCQRLVVGFLYGLEPMDLHAWFEAYVGGRWYTFDPTEDTLRGGRLAVAYGRDAADVAVYHQFGPPAIFSSMDVRVAGRPSRLRRASAWMTGTHSSSSSGGFCASRIRMWCSGTGCQKLSSVKRSEASSWPPGNSSSSVV